MQSVAVISSSMIRPVLSVPVLSVPGAAAMPVKSPIAR